MKTKTRTLLPHILIIVFVAMIFAQFVVADEPEKLPTQFPAGLSTYEKRDGSVCSVMTKLYIPTPESSVACLDLSLPNRIATQFRLWKMDIKFFLFHKI